MVQPDDKSSEIYQYAYNIYKEENKHNSLLMEDDFLEDYQRFWYIIKILIMYQNSGNLNVRLLFNHLIILSNVFGKGLSEILLRLSIEKGNYEVISHIISILYYLGYIPDDKDLFIMGEEYLLTDIPIDDIIIKKIEQGLSNENI